MVITLTVSTFGIIAGQLVASAAGQWFSSHTANQIKDLREQARLDALKREHQRDDERFLKTLQAQLEIEELSHQENLIDIETSFKNAFIKLAHKEALANYPLFISPYLIRKSILSFTSNNVEGNSKQPQLFCILSNSNNPLFNQEVFSLLDSKVNSYLNMYWNAKTTHTVCYYEGVWNNSVSFDDGHPKNLRALMPNAPIVMVTPYLEPEGDKYRFYIKANYWGTEEIMIQPQGLDFLSIAPSLSSDKKEAIVEIVFPWIVCSIAFFADVFYWLAYKDYPILPILLNKGLFNDVSLLSFYSEGYLGLANRCLVYSDGSNSDSELIEGGNNEALLKNLVALNTYNFPEQNVSFLRSVCKLSKDNKSLETLIKGMILSLWRCRTSRIANALDAIDVSELGMKDVSLIAQILEITKSCNNIHLTNDILNILRRKIISPSTIYR